MRRSTLEYGGVFAVPYNETMAPRWRPKRTLEFQPFSARVSDEWDITGPASTVSTLVLDVPSIEFPGGRRNPCRHDPLPDLMSKVNWVGEVTITKQLQER